MKPKMAIKYWQDAVNYKQAQQMAIQALGDIGYMHRYKSENNQVYGFRDAESNRWIIKIAGKEDYQRLGLLKEIKCLRKLKDLGLPVAEIFCTHETLKDGCQPFFIIPYLGKSLKYWEQNNKMITRIMHETGRFIRSLSETKENFFNEDILMDRNITLEYFHAECRDNMAYLKDNGLFDTSVEKCLEWATYVYHNTKPSVGQNQASEPLVDDGGNIWFVDFEGGLNFTYPLKSLECIAHYIENRNEYNIAKNELLQGFYGNGSEITDEVNKEWARWRQYKALTDLVFLSVTRNDSNIFYENWNKYCIK